MSTFLQLVQDLARQSGTLAGGVTLSSVTGVSGRADKLVYWVKTAWEDIQNQRDDWKWSLAEFSDALLINTLRYTGTGSFGLTRFRAFEIDRPDWQPITIYDAAIGVTDETALAFIPYTSWRTMYDRGSHDASRPFSYSISPAGELCVGPKPDKAYVIRGEYRKTPQVLAANSDEPECPSRHHQIIVHRALVLMGESDESPDTFQGGVNEYQRMFAALCHDQLPTIDFCGALA